MQPDPQPTIVIHHDGEGVIPAEIAPRAEVLSEHTPFVVHHDGEPHARCMAALLEEHPEIVDLYGYDRRTALIVHLCTAAQLWLAYTIATTDAWMGTCWGAGIIALFLGGPVTHWAGLGVHEASHLLTARTVLGNRWVAMVGALPAVFPGGMTFCRYHLWHHVFLGIEGRDNDLPSRWEVRHVQAHQPVRKALWLLTYIFFGVVARRYVQRLKFWEWVNVALNVVVIGALLWAAGPLAVVYLLVSLALGYGIHPAAAHWIHEHYLFAGEDQETASYYGPLNYIAFNVGYHNEHHDFMRVPCWRLPELHAICKNTYGALESSTSWSRIMWDFVWLRNMGHRARIVRTMDDFRAASSERAAQKRADAGQVPAHLATHGI